MLNLPDRPDIGLRVVRVEISNRYKNLLNYLANGRWREADEETAEVMLEVAGRKEEGYLRPSDIDEFPCEDLRIINQLWLKFSGDRVGWRREEKWLYYADLTFEINAPVAHLPGLVGCGVGLRSFGVILLSRQDL